MARAFGHRIAIGLWLLAPAAWAQCTYSLTPGSVTIAAAGGPGTTITVTTQAGCPRAASTSTPWITIAFGQTGTGSGTVGWTAAANPLPEARAGSLEIAGVTFRVTQAAAVCSYSVFPTSARAPASGGSGTFTIRTGCVWAARSETPWIKLTTASNGSGETAIGYAVDPNPLFQERTGQLSAAGQLFTVIQAAAPRPVRVSAVVNAASYFQGPVAPGEIVTIYGNEIGPATLATLELAADGRSITKTLALTRVLFDGVAAPVLYASAQQSSAIVPYSVSGRQTTQVQVEYQGLRSDPLTVPVAPAMPGIFTLDASGGEQGAILNQDFSVNGAANPAPRGSVVMIFATGEGQTAPAGVDGILTGLPLPRPLGTVSVRIGGIEANVLYAGGAPDLVAGLLQVNAEIPANIAAGSKVPVLLRIGGLESQSGVTLAVR